jgi:predicted permease
MMALGYFLYHVHILDASFNKKLTTLILNVTTPAMILASVFTGEVAYSKSDIIFTFILAVVIYMLLPFIGYIIAKMIRVKKEVMGVYIFMVVFANVGFMGFPVTKAIFGESAVFLTAILVMLFNFMLYSVGRMIMSFGEGEKVSLNYKNFLSPGIIASVLAIIFYFTELPMPSVFVNTFVTIGDMTTPLAMLVIGATLATIPIQDVFNEKKIYVFTFVKQILFPIVAYPILNMFINNELILGVALISLAMPVGNSVVLFATEYNKDATLGAKAIFMTTLLSVFTIPLIVALFLS